MYWHGLHTIIKIGEKMTIEGIQFAKNYIQNETGLYQIIKKKKDGEVETTYELIGRINIKQIIITKDELGLFEPVLSLSYKDLLYDEDKEIEEKTFNELIRLLEQERLFKKNAKSINSTMNKIIIQSIDDKIYGKPLIIKEKRVFKEGFFIKDGKVVENTPITGLKPTKVEIAKAIKLTNQLLKNRGSAIPNDCTVFRFMLWVPFGWCIKEIGKSKKMYGLVLTGVPKTNKTGSCENFSWLYSNPTDRNQSVDTTSVFGSRLQESTLPAIIDEAYTLLSREEMQDPMKNCIYNKQTRSTKDKSNPQDTIKYLALGLPIFTMNEYIEFKSFITRRYHINYYSADMVVSENDADEFEIEYAPEFEDSPLKTLRHLGRAFADKFIPYVEFHSKELFDLEKLTIKILKEIAEEVGEEFNPAVYETQKSIDSFEVDKCSTIRSGLNNLFRTNYRYAISDFTTNDFISCANNGLINWLYYRKNDQEFVVNKKGFEKEVSKLVGENLDYETILKELDIEVKNITYDSSKVISTTRGNTRGFIIQPEELIEKVFDVQYIKEDKKAKN